MRINFYSQYTANSLASYSRGRVALFALLSGLNIGKGDEVALQTFTCVANPEAIKAAGAVPIYIDIESDGVNMDYQDLEKKITSKTRAIILQHTFGIPAEMDKLLSVAAKKNIPVIEDCCHTLTSQYQGKNVGTFGIGSYYSFEWGKTLVAGIGGALTVHDALLEKKTKEQYAGYKTPRMGREVRIFIQYCAHKLLYRPRLFWPVRSLFHTLGKLGAAESNYNPITAESIAPDFSLRMSRFARNRLDKKLPLLQKITEHSNAVCSRYASEINNPAIKHIPVPKDSVSVYCRYPLLTQNKEKLLKLAKKQNIEVA
ncbi:MAG: DegT/DnrJ/EryC1/StrS aminotransferase family protein, partial [Candidatus Electrothrix sp. AW2]|nr:DegT/DnrJ/EryC1/StrS aminotransferase family protein [Candidatus Electrothrix gigas]